MLNTSNLHVHTQLNVYALVIAILYIMVITITLFLARWYKVGIMTTYIHCYTQHQTEFYYQLVDNSTIITGIVSKLRIKLCLSEYIVDSLMNLSGL